MFSKDTRQSRRYRGILYIIILITIPFYLIGVGIASYKISTHEASAPNQVILDGSATVDPSNLNPYQIQTLSLEPFYATETAFATITSTIRVNPTRTLFIPPTYTPTNTFTPTSLPTLTFTPRPTFTSTSTPTFTIIPTATIELTETPMETPTFTATVEPVETETFTPEPVPTDTDTPMPEDTATPEPSPTFTPTFTNTPEVISEPLDTSSEQTTEETPAS